MKKLLWIWLLFFSTAAAAEKYQFIPIPTEGVGRVTSEYKAQIKNCRVNEDALSDLVVFYGDHIYIYFQNADGTYGEKPEFVRRPEPGAKAPEREPLFHRIEPSFTIDNPNASAFFLEDLDGDGLPEIITISKDNETNTDTVNVFWNKGNWNAPDKEAPKKEPKEEEDVEENGKEEDDEKGFAEEDDVFGAPVGALLLALKDINNDGKIDFVFLSPQGVEYYQQNVRDFGERKLLFKADSIAGWINRDTNQLQRCDFVEDANRDGRMDFFIPVIGAVEIWGANERGEYSRQAELRYDTRQLPVMFGSRFSIVADNILVQPGELEGSDTAGMFMLPAVSFEDIDRDSGKEIILNLGFRNESVWKYDPKEKKYLETPNFRRPWGLRVEKSSNDEGNERKYRMILDRNEAFDPAREPDIVCMQTPFTSEGLRTNLRVFFNCKSLPCLPGTVVPDYNKADASIRESNFIQELVYGDVNGDNRLDLVFFATKYQLTDLKAVMSASKGNLKGDLIFYFYDPALKGGVDADNNRISRGFQNKNNGDFTLRDIKISYDLEAFNQRVFDMIDSAVALNGDFNRDGKKDLMLRTGNNTIQLYFNTGKSEALFPKSSNVTMKAPDYTGLEVFDFNGDGASDFFFSDIRGEDIENPPGSTACRHVLAVSISAKKE